MPQNSIAPAPKASDVIDIEPPVPATLSAQLPDQPPVPPAAENLPEEQPSRIKIQAARHWLILLLVLVILFLVFLLVFHTCGRRLRRQSLRPHPPTSHANIWASHKPPQFLDP